METTSESAGNGVVWWVLLGGLVTFLAAIVAEAVRLLGTVAQAGTSYAPFWWRVCAAITFFLLLYGWEKRKGIS